MLFCLFILITEIFSIRLSISDIENKKIINFIRSALLKVVVTVLIIGDITATNVVCVFRICNTLNNRIFCFKNLCASS